MDTSQSRFKLYDSSGTSLLYTFFAVNDTNAPQSVRDSVEIRNLRSRGSIILDGGESPWNLTMSFYVAGDDYDDVMSEIHTLENTVELNTPYLLRVYRNSVDYYLYKIKRLQPFEYPSNLRLYYQQVNVVMRANAW